MSAAGPPARVPRGRVVLVGVSESTRLEQGFRGPVIRADNLFDAIGTMTTASAAEPVAAVLIASEHAPSSSSALEAIRRVDPSVRLLLLTEPDADPPRADGYDGVLLQPLGARQLAEALEPTSDRSRQPRPAEDATPAPQLGQAAAEHADAPTMDADLGDTDLVEAILTDPAGVRVRALELMIQQTSWSDLILSEAGSDRAASSRVNTAEVCFGQRRFGMLSSARATAGQLQSWATWLARWLALDHSYREFRTMAYHDELTEAGNRRFYDLFMAKTLRNASRQRRPVTVMVFDIDDFKNYNDRFGHDAGDEVLRETVRLLNSVIRSGDKVCRIGGDEFAVIFADLEGPRELGSNHPESVEQIAARFQDQIWQMKFPKLGLDAPGTLSVSGGLATYPWDGTTAADLLHHADQLALQSKCKGKNVITMGPGTQRGSEFGVRGSEKRRPSTPEP